MFPGANAQVYYNEDGEPLGWDYPSLEPDDSFWEDRDDRDVYPVCLECGNEYEEDECEFCNES